MITLTLQELLDILTYNGLFTDVSLVNHQSVLCKLKEIDTKILWDNNIAIEDYTVYTRDAYKYKKDLEENSIKWNKDLDSRCEQIYQWLCRKELFHLIDDIEIMHIDIILGYSTKELEKYTDTQLEELLGQEFIYTRPESKPIETTKEKKPRKISDKTKQKNDDMSEAMALLKSLGVKI